MIDDSYCHRIHSSLTTVCYFDNGYRYVGKQPVAWKEYYVEYWLKELQESMDRCTGFCDITEILLKKEGVKHHSINQSTRFMGLFGIILVNYTPAKRMFSWVYWNQPVRPCVVCVQNTYFCQSAGGGINSFPYGKILDQTKLKAFTDDKLDLTKIIISVFDRVENIVGKGEIACTSNFSFSHNVFKRLLSERRQKVSCGNGLSHI